MLLYVLRELREDKAASFSLAECLKSTVLHILPSLISNMISYTCTCTVGRQPYPTCILNIGLTYRTNAFLHFRVSSKSHWQYDKKSFYANVLKI